MFTDCATVFSAAIGNAVNHSPSHRCHYISFKLNLWSHYSILKVFCRLIHCVGCMKISMQEPKWKCVVRFDVFTAVTMENTVFWDVMLFGSCWEWTFQRNLPQPWHVPSIHRFSQEPHGVTSQKMTFLKICCFGILYEVFLCNEQIHLNWSTTFPIHAR
jgi:hypothetical protein